LRLDPFYAPFTVTPGVDGVPDKVTDIVVVNNGGSPLTGLNTITVSAEVN
jgi:hypothetical protein